LKCGAFFFFQVKVHNFLEKTKKKPQKRTKNEVVEAQTVTKEQEVIHKHLKDLMKKQKGRIVRKIVKERDDSKPWGNALQAKVRISIYDGM
jgi:DNA-directed RNA polymerase